MAEDEVVQVLEGELQQTLTHLYVARMGAMSFGEGRFTVRLWDGMDGCWSDVLQDVTALEALQCWFERTERGTKAYSFTEHIDYYRIFPADTKMHWSGAREMYR